MIQFEEPSIFVSSSYRLSAKPTNRQTRIDTSLGNINKAIGCAPGVFLQLKNSYGFVLRFHCGDDCAYTSYLTANMVDIPRLTCHFRFYLDNKNNGKPAQNLILALLLPRSIGDTRCTCDGWHQESYIFMGGSSQLLLCSYDGTFLHVLT